MACRDFRDSFEVVEPRFKSVVYEFKLYCERKWYKSIMINVSGFVSPFFEAYFFYKADTWGHRFVMLLAGPLGLIGICVGLAFDNLAAVTIMMLSSSFYSSVLFGLNFFYFSGLVIDPLRSKASGFKSFSVSLSSLSKTCIFGA